MVTAPEVVSVTSTPVPEPVPVLDQIKEAAHDHLNTTNADSSSASAVVTNQAATNGSLHEPHHTLTNGSGSLSGSDDGADHAPVDTSRPSHVNGHGLVANGLPASRPTPPPTGRKAIPCRFHYEKRCQHGEMGENCPFSHTIPWQPQADPGYRGGHNRGPSMPGFGHPPMSPTGYANGLNPAQPPYFTPQQSPMEWVHNSQGYGNPHPPTAANGNTQSPHAGTPSQSSPTAPFHDYSYGPATFPHPPYVPYPYYVPPPAMYGGMPPQTNGTYTSQSGGMPQSQGEFAPPNAPSYSTDYPNLAPPSCPPPAHLIPSDFNESGIVIPAEADAGVTNPTGQDGDIVPDSTHVLNGTNEVTGDVAGVVPSALDQGNMDPLSYYQATPSLPASPMSYGPPNANRGRGGPFPSRGRSMYSGRGRSMNGRSRYPSLDGATPTGDSGERPPRGPCSFFAQSICRYGDTCLFAHVMPNGDDARDYHRNFRSVDGPTSTDGAAKHAQIPRSDTFVPHDVPGFAIWRERQQKEKQNKIAFGSGHASQGGTALPRDPRWKPEAGGMNMTEMRQKVDDLVQQRREGGFPGRKSLPPHIGGHMNASSRHSGPMRHAPPYHHHSHQQTASLHQPLPLQQKIPCGDDFPALTTSTHTAAHSSHSTRSDMTSSGSLPKPVMSEKDALPGPSPALAAAALVTTAGTSPDTLSTSVSSSQSDTPHQATDTTNVTHTQPQRDWRSVQASSSDNVVSSTSPTPPQSVASPPHTTTLHQGRPGGSFASVLARAVSAPPPLPRTSSATAAISSTAATSPATTSAGVSHVPNSAMTARPVTEVS